MTRDDRLRALVERLNAYAAALQAHGDERTMEAGLVREAAEALLSEQEAQGAVAWDKGVVTGSFSTDEDDVVSLNLSLRPAPVSGDGPAPTAGDEEAARRIRDGDDPEVEAMLAACVPGGDICDPQHVADALRDYLAAAALRQRGEVTEEMVERACRAFFEKWDTGFSTDENDSWRPLMRAALTAALGKEE